MKKIHLKYFAVIVGAVLCWIFYVYHNPCSQIPHVSFYFIRHGQTNGNVQNLIQGSTDTELNETGIQEAHEAAQLLKEKNIKTIVASPLKRARSTAEIIAKELNKEVIFLDCLVEQSAGALENEPYESWIKYWDQGKITVVNGESWNDFTQRIKQALCFILKFSGPILIVSHGRVGVVLQQLLIPKDEHVGVKNAQPIFFSAPSTKEDSWHLIN